MCAMSSVQYKFIKCNFIVFFKTGARTFLFFYYCQRKWVIIGDSQKNFGTPKQQQQGVPGLTAEMYNAIPEYSFHIACFHFISLYFITVYS